jgi:hypothetical protein
MPKARALFAVLASFLLAACMLPARSGASGGAPTGTIAIVPDDPNDDPKDFGRPGDPAGYSHSKAMAAECGCFADVAEKSLDAAVAEARGKSGGHPAVDMSIMQLMSCGGPGAPQVPAMPVMPRTGPARRAGDIATKAKARGLDVDVAADGTMHATPPGQGGPDGAALDGLAASVSSALRVANLAEQQCNAMALQRGTSLVINVSTRDVNSGLSDLPGYVARERARLHRVIAAAKRADAIAASASTLAASLRNAVQTGSGKTVDATADALAAALPVAPMTASDEELDALMAAADHDASVILEKAHEWAREQVAAGHGIAGSPGMAAAGGTSQPVMAEGDASDASAVVGAFMGLFHGDIGAIVRGAAVLFPKDSPIRNGLTATGALLKGDIVTAVRSAARMVPADTAIGQALATAEGIIDTAQNLGDKVHAVKALTGSGS